MVLDQFCGRVAALPVWQSWFFTLSVVVGTQKVAPAIRTDLVRTRFIPSGVAVDREELEGNLEQW